MRLREQKLRDLGGLSLEMYRRDRFREDLLLERCAELIGLEARIHELDVLLGRPARARRDPHRALRVRRPLLWGSRFCATCGRPVAAGGARRGASDRARHAALPALQRGRAAEQEYCLECGGGSGRARARRASSARPRQRRASPRAGAWMLPALSGSSSPSLGTGAAIAISDERRGADRGLDRDGRQPHRHRRDRR